MFGQHCSGIAVRLLEDPDSDGTGLDYIAAPGEPNELAFLSIYNGRAGVQDGFGAVAITPEPPCRRDPADGWPNEPRFASCPADRLMWIRADLGDGADSGVASMATSFPIVVSGGSGPDRLTGGWGADELYGDEGWDELSGWAGDDLLDAPASVAYTVAVLSE